MESPSGFPKTSCKSQRIRGGLWLPRFSVRTLAIVITLICLYLGCWEITKKFGTISTSRGVTKSKNSVWFDVTTGTEPERITVDSSSPAPFIVSSCEYRFEYRPKYRTKAAHIKKRYSVAKGAVYYYLWFFGLTMQLPFESTWDLSQ